MREEYDVTVVGGGPAGYVAAIRASQRQARRVALGGEGPARKAPASTAAASRPSPTSRPRTPSWKPARLGRPGL
ncbi:MAG: FAD-binding protein [Candidatus Moduliflexus flocculans]|nr:FAD-binding protein [Candidatus Moduliflexus flocculans]